MLVRSKQIRIVEIVAMSNAKLSARPNNQQKHKSTSTGISGNDVSRAADQQLPGSVSKLDLAHAATAWSGQTPRDR